jgi:2-keto-4-pentenoate hydratase/2-oxohepta-3-ene-1,7-dioic acid hydratase in catechol pathway
VQVGGRGDEDRRGAVSVDPDQPLAPKQVEGLAHGGGALQRAIAGGERDLRAGGELEPRDRLHLGPPVPDPPKIICLGRNIDAALPLEHVAGAMAFNDVSARDLQMANPLWTAQAPVASPARRGRAWRVLGPRAGLIAGTAAACS